MTCLFLAAAETRFAYLFTACDRLVEVRKALETLMLDDDYKQWSEQPAYEDKAEEIRSLIQSRHFWKRMDEFTKICLYAPPCQAACLHVLVASELVSCQVTRASYLQLHELFAVPS